MKVDLHMHSIFSDAELTPEELVARAKKQGYSAIALTDHDTVRGSRAFARAAGAGIRSISGVELTCTHEGREIHMLGYRVDVSDGAFGEFRTLRIRRMERILCKLSAVGMQISMEEIYAAGTDVPSRYHIAKLMAQKGYVADIADAYAKFLNRGRPAWEDYARISPEDAMDTVARAGGISVLAHPKRSGLSGGELRAFVARLASAGLRGIESYYATHTREDVEECRRLAAEFGLVNTNGSDFHRERDGALHGGSREFAYSRPDMETVRVLGLE